MTDVHELPTIPCPEKGCKGVLEMNPLLYVGIRGSLEDPTFHVYGLDTEDTKVNCSATDHFIRMDEAFLRKALSFLANLEFSILNG